MGRRTSRNRLGLGSWVCVSQAEVCSSISCACLFDPTSACDHNPFEHYATTPQTRNPEFQGNPESHARKCRLDVLIRRQYTDPASFERLGVSPVGGVLLTGPTGCGKTMLAHSLAASLPVTAVAVKCPELFKRYLGESEAAVRDLFAHARRCIPCILILDEIESGKTWRPSRAFAVAATLRMCTPTIARQNGAAKLHSPRAFFASFSFP